jgi:predicted transcriptional regulator
MTSSTLDVALDYIGRGWSPIPIPHRQKRPKIEGWQTLRVTAADARRYFNGEDQNVGALLGEASHGLTDVDLDCAEAVAAAPFFLPHRTARFGRASKQCSHWLYRTTLHESEDKATIQYKDGATVLLELRCGGGGSGAQTVFPGSVHPSGEAIEWTDERRDEAEIDGGELKRLCGRNAAAAIIARHYPQQGGRHDAALVFGGFIARCGFSVSEAKLFAEGVAAASGQPSDKRRDIVDTAADCVVDLAAGKQIAGFPKLAETFGRDVAKKVADWLGYSGPTIDLDPRFDGGFPPVNEAPPLGEPSPDRKPPSRVVGAGTFMRGYTPISYTFEGILPSGYLYGLTAKQGSGKTAFMIAGALATITGDEAILGCAVEKGRVAYVTIENPVDFRMKLAVNCHVHKIAYDAAERMIAIIDGRDAPEQIVEGLRLDAEANGGFQLVCFDTFQAGFSAACAGAFNDNEAVLKYTISLRPLTMLPGCPSVIVAFHPTKNATESELIPYGGGSVLNEIDGNLTIWKDGPCKLYHNRLRGPEFEPRYFRIEKMAAPEIVDSRGRPILLPVCFQMAEATAEQRQEAEASTDIRILQSYADNEFTCERIRAAEVGVGRSKLQRLIAALAKAGFLQKSVAAGKYCLTKKGREELEALTPKTPKDDA